MKLNARGPSPLPCPVVITGRALFAREIVKEVGTSMLNVRLSRVEDNGAVVVDRDNREVFLEAERVVIAIGSRPDNSPYDQIRALGYEVHQIGDCLEPRSAKAAISEGAVLGRAI